jgi:hypothetical protein
MKRQGMQPFRAPRKHNVKSSPIRQSPRRQGKQKDTTDSEEATELGVVWQPYVIKETQYSDFDEVIDNGKSDQNGERFSIEANYERSPVTHRNQTAISSNSASPSCSEFEAFLEKSSAAAVAPKTSSNNDAYWENVLEAEKQRLAKDIEARMIPVDDIMLGDDSADDLVPIASTIREPTNKLSLLVDVATTANSSPSLRRKKTPKVFIPHPKPTSGTYTLTARSTLP